MPSDVRHKKLLYASLESYSTQTTMKSSLIACCFYFFGMTGSCFAQSSPKDIGILSPHGDTRTSVFYGADVSTNSALGMDDRPLTIFKDEMNKDSGNQGHLSDRPLLSSTPKQSFGNIPSSDRGGVNQGYVGPFNTPSNNPKGAYIGIDVPLFGK